MQASWQGQPWKQNMAYENTDLMLKLSILSQGTTVLQDKEYLTYRV